MCRIWGISYGPGGPEAEDWTPSELAQIMFPALVRLGPHAWGWMANVDGEVVSDKHPGRCDTKKAMAKMNLPENPRWIIGHTRMATHGSPEDNRNNHPLRHGQFMGIHNGVLRNHESILAITGREDEETEVDSEAIFAAVNKWGHRAGLKKIIGDMVTVYVNLEKPETVHVGRTQGRPLLWARTRAGSIIWASESQAIDACDLVDGKHYSLPAHSLYRFRAGEVVKRIRLREQQDIGNPPPPSRPTGSRKPTNLRGEPQRYSVGATRRAMWSAQARAEKERAEAFIERERSQIRVKSATKARTSLADPISQVKKTKTDPDWGTVSDDGQRYFVGNGRWVHEREFIAIVLDELGWD